MGAFGPDAKQLLLEGINSDYWTSVVSSVVCLAVLVHSTALHRKAWKRPRIHTESCAVCTFLGGTTLLLGELNWLGAGRPRGRYARGFQR